MATMRSSHHHGDHHGETLKRVSQWTYAYRGFIIGWLCGFAVWAVNWL